eukprot:3421449-Alexandrium_andersonii.AAC.1
MCSAQRPSATMPDVRKPARKTCGVTSCIADLARAIQDDFDPEDLDGDCYFPRDGYNYEQHLM